MKKVILFLGIVFFTVYCSYPFVASYFTSVEKANKSNIKKFERNRNFFQGVVDSCIEIYVKQSKDYITKNDISLKTQRKVSNRGINFFEAKIVDSDNENINIIIVFRTDRLWKNNILNNVSIRYSSNRKFDECKNDENVFNARMSIICLGGGWFFEVDTDWL